MKMKNLTVTKFRGVEFAVYDLDTVNVFTGTNGKGKSSTLDAIRFALCGKASAKDVRFGAESAEVNITFEDGSTISRCITATGKGTQSAKINGKKAGSLKVVNEWLENKLGYPVSVLETALTADYILSLSGKDLNNLLLSLLPVRLNTETVMKFLSTYKGTVLKKGEVTELEKEKILSILPKEETYPLEVIDGLYKQLFEERKILKKEVKALEARSVFDENKVDGKPSLKALERQKSEIERKLGQAELAARFKQQLKLEESLKLQAENLKDVKQPDMSYKETLTARKILCQDGIKTATANLSQLRANTDQWKKMLESMDASVCPYSRGTGITLTCNTDRSVLKTIAEEMIRNNTDKETETNAYIVRCEKQINLCEKQMEKLYLAQENWVKKQETEKRLADLEATKQQLSSALNLNPEELKEKLKAVQEEILLWNMYNAAKMARNALEKERENLEVLEFLVPALDGKGIKSLVIEKAVKAFEANANKIAGKIRKDFSIAIRAVDGITMYARFHENGPFVAMEKLSSGEQMLTSFLLISILKNVTKADYLALDSADRLDTESIKNLLALLAESKMFDTVFVGMVNHTDSIDAVRDVEGVKLLNI